jgi:hypothetical protein
MRQEGNVDILESLLRAALMIVGMFVAIGLVAALFMILFGIATGMDDRMTD